jgi:hypothetical protein
MRAAFVRGHRSRVNDYGAFLQMFHGCLHHEKEREDVCPKRSLQLFLADLPDGILRVLFGRVVHENVELAEFLYSLVDRSSTKVRLAYVATNQQAFATLFFDLTPSFIRVLVFFEVNDCNVGAFLGERDGNRAANPAVAASNDRDLLPQLPAAAMFFVLGPGPRLHLVFAAGLPSLVLPRLQFLFFRHGPCARCDNSHCKSQRRRLRVRAAFFAAPERDRAERRLATRFVCLDNARLDADRRLSRLSARFVARERLAEGFLRRPARPRVRSRLAWRFVRFLPRFGGGNFTPARRAFDNPMAIACSGERAPCSPSRMCSISSRTNSPACVLGAMPSRSSSRARSIASSSGIIKMFRLQRELWT